MNAWLARLLTRLYPRAWRERYGEEFEELLRNGRGGLHAAANVLWSACCEHIVPTQKGEMEQSSHAFRFHGWCIRAPWAVFALAPLALLAGAYLIACLYLWSLWTIFLPGADTPFGVRWTGPPYALQNLCFQFGKFYYFGAPILVGWGIGLIAARQRMKAVWPAVGLVLIALMGGTAEIHASRSMVPAGLGHIRMDFFAFGPSAQGIYANIFQALLILLLTVPPWLIWRRLQSSRSSLSC
jgi:hypothetical protein